MPGFASVLVYDGECPDCSVAARALEELDDIGAVSWYDEAAQTFLAAQFSEPPFAMVLIDRPVQRVYAGRAAAEELASRAGMPDLVGSLVGEHYGTIARVVGLASGRTHAPADVHDQYALADSARDAFDTLAANAVARDA